MHEPKTVFTAAALTAAMVFGLTIYACVTKEDFTESLCGFFIVAVLLCMIVALIPIYIFVHPLLAHLMWCTVGVFIFSFYIIWDTQVIIGGKHKHAEFDVDDYILAAIILYIDIIQLFLYILELTSGGD